MRDGFVVVDKAPGWTSHDVVAKLRGVYGQKRVGHAGTLDPDATGVLLVGLGRVTRLLRYPAGSGQGVPRRASCSGSRPTRSTRRARCWSAPRCRRPGTELDAARAVRRRHRTGPAHGVGAEGRRPAPATSWRARAKRSSARPGPCTSTSSSSKSSSPARTPRRRSGSRVRAAPTSARSRPTSGPRWAVPRTSDRCGDCASAASPSTKPVRSRRSRPIPMPRCVRPTEAMRDLERSTSTRNGRVRWHTVRRSRRPRCVGDT